MMYVDGRRVVHLLIVAEMAVNQRDHHLSTLIQIRTWVAWHYCHQSADTPRNLLLELA